MRKNVIDLGNKWPKKDKDLEVDKIINKYKMIKMTVNLAIQKNQIYHMTL
jgi:hypothetical protein